MATVQNATDRIVNIHYLNAWKEGRIFYRNVDGEPFMCDGFVIRRIDGPLPILYDRNVAPRIPQKGEGFASGKDTGIGEQCPKFETLIPDRKAKGLVQLAVTKWRYESDKGVCVVFAFPDARVMLVHVKLAALFGDDVGELLRYRFFGTSPDKILRVEDSAGRLAGGIGPMVLPQAQAPLSLPTYTLPVVKQPKIKAPTTEKIATPPTVENLPSVAAAVAASSAAVIGTGAKRSIAPKMTKVA